MKGTVSVGFAVRVVDYLPEETKQTENVRGSGQACTARLPRAVSGDECKHCAGQLNPPLTLFRGPCHDQCPKNLLRRGNTTSVAR